MSDALAGSGSRLVALITRLGYAGISAGRQFRSAVTYVGGLAYLLWDTLVWTARGLFSRNVRLGRSALAAQMVRVGVRSIPIVFITQMFIGVILALQMAPTLESYGSIDRVANIVAIAIFRELGPLFSAIILSGFAGASIAAEIGAMVEAEEIKALRAHALNPIHFLVVPRVLATVIMLIGLSIMADIVGVMGGMFTSVTLLGLTPENYLENTRQTLTNRDFLTGLVKAGVFGMIVALIACYEGLNVRGGAVGVGRATTATVVRCIVSLIAIDCVFTSCFYLFEL